MFNLKINTKMKVKMAELHEVSTVKCDVCTYSWVAVRPEGLTKLECPNCGGFVFFENVI